MVLERERHRQQDLVALPEVDVVHVIIAWSYGVYFSCDGHGTFLPR